MVYRNFLIISFIIAFFSASSTAQKFTVKEDACPATENAQALKVYKKIDKAKDGTEKRELLEKAIELEPEFHEALFDLSIRMFRSGNHGRASELLSQVEALCADYSAYTYYMQGWIAFYEEDFSLSETKFQKFLTYDYIDDKAYGEVKDVLDSVSALAKLYANPVPFDPKPVTGVCTEKDEYLGSLTPDNRNFYYIRVVKIAPNAMNSAIGGYEEPREVFMVSRHYEGSYDSGSPMDSPFNTTHNNGAAAVTADNKEMYFVVSDDGTAETCDLWYSRMVDGNWSELKRLGKNVNSSYWDSQPTVSYDGKTLIFTSNRPGGQGMSDLYYCTRNENGEWGPAQNLGSTINTPYSDISPFLHSDSQTLYFSSQGHFGLGLYDVFYSRKDSAGNWITPQNIGYPINSKESDVSFFVSLDGKTGYYSSSKLEGPGGFDIFSFEMPEQARPEEVYFVEGSVSINPEVGKVETLEVKNLTTNTVTTINVDSTDGTYVAILAAKDDYILSLKQEGVAFQSTYISEETASVGEPSPAETLEVKTIKTGEAYRLNDVNFPTNSYELSQSAKNILNEFSEFLALNSKLKIAIHGHTDNVGNASDNLTLSDNRAKAVYEYLISQGIDASRLSYKGFGSTKPLAPNTTEDGKAKNRRTEFVIQP